MGNKKPLPKTAGADSGAKRETVVSQDMMIDIWMLGLWAHVTTCDDASPLDTHSDAELDRVYDAADRVLAWVAEQEP